MNSCIVYIAIAYIKERNVDLPTYYQKKYNEGNIHDRKTIETTCYLLKKYLNIDSSYLIQTNAYGKPFIEHFKYDFNISHSGNYVVLAFSKEKVGIDIENVQMIPIVALKRVLNKQDYQRLEKKENQQDFPLLKAKEWTRIEAILKAKGTGFYLDPREDDLYREKWQTLSFVYQHDYVITCASPCPFHVQMI